MKRAMSGIGALLALLLFAGIMAGGLYLRSLHAPALVGESAASPSPTDVASSSPSPSDSPSPTPVASPTPPSPSPAPRPAVPAQPAHPAPTCPALVITSFTGRPAAGSVVLAWTISGGCGDETGWIQGSFTGTMYPGLWVVPIHSAWKTYTDHPQKPAGAQQVCTFSLTYVIDTNGTAPDGRGVPAVFAQVDNVNLC